MLVYLAAAYTEIEDKDEHMRNIMKFAFEYMAANPYVHIISPLFYHFGLKDNNVPGNYKRWKEYSQDLLQHCEGIIVYEDPQGLWRTSVGVADEMYLARVLRIKEIF